MGNTYSHYSIERIQTILQRLEISFLDPTYTSLQTRHLLKCNKCNHIWRDKVYFFLGYKNQKVKGCLNCSSIYCTKTSIIRFFKEHNINFRLANNQNVKNGKTLLAFICEKGHLTKKPFNYVKNYYKTNGNQAKCCKICRKKEKYTLRMQHWRNEIKHKPSVKLIKISGVKSNCRFHFFCKKGHHFKCDLSIFKIKIRDHSSKTGCTICDLSGWTMKKIKK